MANREELIRKIEELEAIKAELQRRRSQTIGLEGQPPMPPMAADMAIDESMPPMTQEVFGQGIEDVSTPLSESEIIRSRDIARESLLSDAKFKESTPEEREAMIDKAVASQPGIGLGASTYPDLPTIGGSEYNKYISEQLGISPWSAGQLKVAAQSVLANPENVVNTVVSEIPGATKFTDERTGEVSVVINGKRFAPSVLAKVMGDMLKYSPVGAATTVPARLAATGAIATGSELLSSGLGGGQDFVEGLGNVASEVGSQLLGEGAEKLIEYGGRKIFGKGSDIISDYDANNIFKNLRSKEDALVQAAESIKKRDAIAIELGVDPATIPLTPQQAIGDPTLLRRADEIWKTGTENSDKIANALRAKDEGLEELTRTYLETTGALGEQIEPRVRNALLQGRKDLKKNLDAEAKVMFDNFSNQIGEVDVAPVLDDIDNFIQTKTPKGKDTKSKRALLRAKKLIQPEKIKAKVNVPIKTKQGTVIGPEVSEDVVKTSSKTFIPETKVLKDVTEKGDTFVSGKRVGGESVDVITGKPIASSKAASRTGKVVEGEEIDIVTGKPKRTVVERVVGGKRVQGIPIDPITGKELTEEQIQEFTTTKYTDIRDLHNVYKEVSDMVTDFSDPLKKMTNRDRMLLDIKNKLKTRIDESIDGLGDANRAYREGRERLEELDAGLTGRIMKMDDEKVEEVSKLLFSNKYIKAGKPTPAFRNAVTLIRKNDEEALGQLASSEFDNIIRTVSDASFGDAGAVKKVIDSQRSQITLLKEAFGNNSKQSKMLDGLISLYEVGSRGKATKELQGMAEETVRRYTSFGWGSVKPRAYALAANFFNTKKSERYQKSLGKILSMPDSKWFHRLEKALNDAERRAKTNGNIAVPLAQLERLLDNYEQEETE